MFRSKVILVLAVVFLSTISIFSQSFTYSGPSEVTVNYGSTTATATFYFSYSNLDAAHKVAYPMLNIKVDGTQINSYNLCNNPQTPSSYGISLTPGSHTITFTLMSVDWYSLNCYQPTFWQENEVTVNCKFKVSIENIFGGGSIYADGNRTSPFLRTSVSGDNVSVGAIEQSYSGYNWIWNTSGTYNSEWTRVPSGISSSVFSYSQNTSYSVQSNDANTAVVAGLRKISNITFQNNFVGVGNGGVITVNGTQYNSPTSQFQVVEQNAINASANTYYYNNYIEYTFSQWNDGNTSSTRTFYPSANTTYTASFIGKPTNSGEYAGASADVGDPIVVTWVDNPNTAVNQFQIWRRVKHNGVVGSAVLLTTVGRGVQTYTDNEYAATDGYTNDLLWYDVRAYYSTEGTYSDPDFQAVWTDKCFYCGR